MYESVMFKCKVDMGFGHLEPQRVLSPVWTNGNNAEKVMRKLGFSKKLQMGVNVSRKFVE
jgi:hypothetical protein